MQFNFLSFDELVPFLPKFRWELEHAQISDLTHLVIDLMTCKIGSHRENFPNVEHYEFSETNLHSMNQLNALAQVGFYRSHF